MKYNTHMIKINNREQLLEEMRKLGADEPGIRLMAPKAETILIKIQNLSLKAANLIKQEMLSKGGDAVLHKDVSMLTKETSDVLLIGTRRQYWEIIRKLKVQPFGLKQVGREIESVLYSEDVSNRERTLHSKGIDLTIGRHTLVMGILNVTPDSFSDGGKYNQLAIALKHAKKMIADGADIIDVGGESTRPGHQEVSVEEELERVIPVIRALAKEIKVPISVDTYKAEVAQQAIEAGAHIINDVWGFKKDPNMAKVVAEYQVPVILMHNRMNMEYDSLMDDIIADLRESIQIAITAGVKADQIILDPGIGFAKTYQDNLLVMNRLDEIVALGYPVLLGTSRKSIIGNTLHLPVDERLEGTAATVAMGIVKGCKIMRVHDVKEMKRVCKMMDAMIYMEGNSRWRNGQNYI
ncbi:dihydropteroate synthase [Tepidibacillus sp. HK-1]|uniref:dihydropteroate synthase n=1 Tax=Tepidibacillus sp. HK-1 TaxID=1883407 RepID=UPI000857C243|nr:dihydropteroate synthase [Tepidibacillus sp. HK-1]GBF11378.1 dihydropteroate synthase [Tepidibacillus sp. HK-1]